MAVPLDVSDAFGIDLMDEFEVIRRPYRIDENGRPIITEQSMGVVMGVVTPASPAALVRTGDYENIINTTQFITQFQIINESYGYQPDHIKYDGDLYLVIQVNDYSAYGEGFIQAIAQSIKPFLGLP